MILSAGHLVVKTIITIIYLETREVCPGVFLYAYVYSSIKKGAANDKSADLQTTNRQNFSMAIYGFSSIHTFGEAAAIMWDNLSRNAACAFCNLAPLACLAPI